MSVNKNRIHIGDNLPFLKTIQNNSVNLIYIDPPFNTGKRQARTQIKTTQEKNGDRIGFNGRPYKTTKLGTKSFDDMFDDYIGSFLQPRLKEAKRVLHTHGTLYFHIDYREVHRCKILLDQIFRDGCFLGEIIWAYDYGGRSKKKWPAKHDNILVYAKHPNKRTFNSAFVKKMSSKAPGPNGALVDIPPTDTWWHTIVPTNGKEKTGYPTQKPLGVVGRIIQTSSKEGDLVLDFFAGSGTVGASCLRHNRKFTLIDNNPQAKKVMERRFANIEDIEWSGISSTEYH